MEKEKKNPHMMAVVHKSTVGGELHSFGVRREEGGAPSSSREYEKMGHLAEENAISTASVVGFTVTWAVMLPQRDFMACQEKISGGRRGKSPAEGKLKKNAQDFRFHKRTSNKLLSVTVLSSRPDLVFHMSPLPFGLLWLL